MGTKITPNKSFSLQVKKSHFLLVEAKISGCTLVLSLIVLSLSSVEAAEVIAPFSFSKGSASLKIAEIVVFGPLSISRSDGTIGTYFHSGEFLSLLNKDSVVCCSLCNIEFHSCFATLASIFKRTLG